MLKWASVDEIIQKVIPKQVGPLSHQFSMIDGDRRPQHPIKTLKIGDADVQCTRQHIISILGG